MAENISGMSKMTVRTFPSVITWGSSAMGQNNQMCFKIMKG